MLKRPCCSRGQLKPEGDIQADAKRRMKKPRPKDPMSHLAFRCAIIGGLLGDQPSSLVGTTNSSSSSRGRGRPRKRTKVSLNAEIRRGVLQHHRLLSVPPGIKLPDECGKCDAKAAIPYICSHVEVRNNQYVGLDCPGFFCSTECYYEFHNGKNNVVLPPLN